MMSFIHIEGFFFSMLIQNLNKFQNNSCIETYFSYFEEEEEEETKFVYSQIKKGFEIEIFTYFGKNYVHMYILIEH